MGGIFKAISSVFGGGSKPQMVMQPTFDRDAILAETAAEIARRKKQGRNATVGTSMMGLTGLAQNKDLLGG